VKRPLFLLVLGFLAQSALSIAQTRTEEVSLRLGGKEIQLAPASRARLAVLAREVLSRCGPNTRQHPGNFGQSAASVEQRWRSALEGSGLRVRFAQPMVTESHLGGRLEVSEALIVLEHPQYFVGPDFTRYGSTIAEHLQCDYLPSLELACLAELAPHLPARYREICAKLERDARGRIVMPPPDVAPSCS